MIIRPAPGEPSQWDGESIQDTIRSGPSDRKERCKKIVNYLQSWIEDRFSRDDIARAVWYEQLYKLKKECWWSYRNFTHWLRDYDYTLAKRAYGHKGCLDPEWRFSDGELHRPHRSGGGGMSSGSPSLRTEGPDGEIILRRWIFEWFK